MNSAVERGKRGEREIARIIEDLSGWRVRRRLQQGRVDDAGDLEGLPGPTTAQVKNYRDIARGLREAMAALPTQQAIAGSRYGVCFLRRPGGKWVACMDVSQFIELLREATDPDSDDQENNEP